ncbi:ABC transporter ATP-binding protein [Haloarcula rubripromontorii]|uniref:Cobalamin import ATP-binding protein BtuD n=2 Tax=Haloarcula rubripromontorii TaxID=1705562 RepID=A0A0M9AH65_9EURY|nr:ABC transporter ATP-binding protein [Haloarcula rubripromontorii]NLV06953.1 ATP-binding cassette domain-containing protein [Haloarcula rubripromontorii]
MAMRSHHRNDTDEATTESNESRPAVVELTDVSFGYTSTPVVEDITVSIDAGEYVAVVGPNGSGKSTLMQLLLGLLEPDSGTAKLFGVDATAFDDGAKVGYVAQRAGASREMPITVREVVKMGRFPHVGFGRLSAADWRIVDRAIDTVGMSAFADRRITQLSGGQRQRAFIARALAGEADLLVLDEPTVGVDTESVDAFYGLLESLHADGITVLLIEHDLQAVIDHAERVICLNREVYFDGPSAEFTDSAALARAFGTGAQSLTGGNR